MILESLAGPEAALQMKHTAVCPGRKKEVIMLLKCFVVKYRKKNTTTALRIQMPVLEIHKKVSLSFT